MSLKPIVVDAYPVAYARLNTAQRQAVDTIEGPVMVIAGPGTGKTQILTLRIVNILRQTDAQPENILALTFTNAGAHAMRTRLRTFIGAAAYRVPIHTFHSFAEVLIKQYPEAYPRIIGGRAASDLEVISIIEDILHDPQFVALRPSGRPDYYLRSIVSALSDLKKEGYSPDAFGAFVARQAERLTDIVQYHEKGVHKGKVRSEYTKAEKQLTKNQELVALYRRYEATMTAARLYDFDDMVLETVRALEQNEDMRLMVQETYQYVLADEQQDVNGSQNRILALVTEFHSNPNLFVVGDEKQAIYRFQGASLKNFLQFQDRYPEALIISLTDNYRSSQSILDLSQLVVATDDAALAALRTPLAAATSEVATIERRTFTHQATEDAWVVEAVTRALSCGISAAEIAVIVRKNRQVEHYASLLRSQGVAVAPSADTDLLQHPLTQALLRLVTAVTEPSNEEVLMQVLHESYWQLAPGDMVQLLSQRSYARPLAALVTDPVVLETLADPAAVTNLVAVLATAREKALTEAPQRVVAYLLEASGLLTSVLSADTTGNGRVIRRLYDEVEALCLHDSGLTLAGIVRSFRQRITYRLALSAPLVPHSSEAVAIMTAHKSKGLEFSVVIMPDITDGVWSGGSRTETFELPVGGSSDDDETSDDARLFYVALTRAKRTLLLSYATLGSGGKERSPAAVLELLTQPLVVDSVPDENISDETLLAAITSAPPASISPTFLAEVLVAQGLSATSLNNYCKSPWTYLYRNVLHVPAPKTFSLQYGTALHSVIDACVRLRGQGAEPTATFLKAELERALSRLPLAVSEYTRMHERGLATLVSYLPYLHTAPRQRTEAHFTAVLPIGHMSIPELTITGNLDRLDFDSDGTLVSVTDYKTGKPKTRGQIEGDTKDSEGEYKRQLTFYALLLSLQDDPRLHCRSMTLTFLESATSGVLREETFIITDEEIATLRTELKRIAVEIATGAFLTTSCDTVVCEYCDLVAKLR